MTIATKTYRIRSTNAANALWSSTHQLRFAFDEPQFNEEPQPTHFEVQQIGDKYWFVNPVTGGLNWLVHQHTCQISMTEKVFNHLFVAWYK